MRTPPWRRCAAVGAGSIAAMRRAMLGSVALVALAACTGTAPSTATPTRPVSSTASPIASGSASTTATPGRTPTPEPELPEGVPATYAGDVPSGDVPLRALIPRDATVDGSWYATTPAGEAILVAFAHPGPDPFRAERGFAVWRRFTERPPWRALYGVVHPADEGVVATQALIADVTGDGSPDAIVNEITGGSGGCGTWRVVDLAGGSELWNRTLCDAQVVSSSDPIGIEITEAVFKQGDAHCCPSATRTTVLTYAGDGRWTVASRVLTPTGG